MENGGKGMFQKGESMGYVGSVSSPVLSKGFISFCFQGESLQEIWLDFVCLVFTQMGFSFVFTFIRKWGIVFSILYVMLMSLILHTWYLSC